jgi:cytochrome c
MSSRFFFACLASAVGMGFNTLAAADSIGVDLARSNNCLACHQIDQKRVGPSFKLISERFANQDGALDYLATTIRQGGRGRWGAVPMPAQPQVSPANAQLIAAWILTLANNERPKIK